jgi:hypothetical protein
MLTRAQLSQAYADIDVLAEKYTADGKSLTEATDKLAKLLGVLGDDAVHVAEQRAWGAINAVLGIPPPKEGDVWETKAPSEVFLRLIATCCALDGLMGGLRAGQIERLVEEGWERWER